MKNKYLILWLMMFFTAPVFAAPPGFVGVKGHQFIKEGKPWYFVGTNYWYGAIASLTEQGRSRVKAELDFLKLQGVTNVRVLAAAEGEGMINGVRRVEPAFQTAKNVFNTDLLTGLDFLLAELDKRNMTAVLFLSNNWEWSGGFLQYLNWNGQLADSVMRRKLSWDENRDIVKGFYSCEPCMVNYELQVQKVLSRVNTITGRKYTEEPAIMAWELANEPRPMRPSVNEQYLQWIARAAAYIKKLDPHHLVTTGCEGEMGVESAEVFKRMHQVPAIDYATIHIWPKNWSWFSDTSIHQKLSSITKRANNYIQSQAAMAKAFGKPMVIEEFGLPRDGHSFEPGTSVGARDRFFAAIFQTVVQSRTSGGAIAGCNFWAFSGVGRAANGHLFWQPGDDLLGDPPQEEQGLNSVFQSDATTWQLIRSVVEKLK